MNTHYSLIDKPSVLFISIYVSYYKPIYICLCKLCN